MKLLTKEIERKLAKNPLYSHEGEGTDAQVLVKFFNPVGRGTWLITEGNKLEDGNWELFGYFHIYDWEWGYIFLSDLESLRLPFGMKIERDIHARGTVAENIKH